MLLFVLFSGLCLSGLKICFFIYIYIHIDTLRSLKTNIYSKLHYDTIMCTFCRAGNSRIDFLSKLLVFCPKMSEWAIRLKKRVIHSCAHFWWATWAIRSRSFISSERPERISHGRSFLVSNLSDSLTVAQLSWAIWANRSQSLIWFEWNERMSEWAMSKWANSQPWWRIEAVDFDQIDNN